jgi:hypothetical protein
MSQQKHWDEVTRQSILDRIAGPDERTFFDEREFETVTALIGCLLDLDAVTSEHLALTIDGRLAGDRTDGWRYDDMPQDEQAWHRSLAGLDEEAAGSFAELDPKQKSAIVATVQKADRWHELPAGRLFDLWLRYACTAYYAQPSAWNEIGFAGPAYPRGYKNPGVDSREPFEVQDAHPSDDPSRGQDT